MISYSSSVSSSTISRLSEWKFILVLNKIALYADNIKKNQKGNHS